MSCPMRLFFVVLHLFSVAMQAGVVYYVVKLWKKLPSRLVFSLLCTVLMMSVHFTITEFTHVLAVTPDPMFVVTFDRVQHAFFHVLISFSALIFARGLWNMLRVYADHSIERKGD